MSGQIKLKLPSGGSKTIAAPDSAATETITLPAGTKTLATVENFTSTGIDVTGTVIADGLTVDTNTLYVDSANNRVGIGTSSPAAKLHVNSNVLASSANDADVRDYRIEFSGRQQTGGIDFNLSSPTAFLDFYAGGSPTNLGAWSGGMRFHTGGTDQTGTERMRIDSSGRVGIGTSSPSSKLSVQGDASFVSGFTSYTSDGLFSTNATPLKVVTPNGNSYTSIGYRDNGLNNYYPRIGFYSAYDSTASSIGSAGTGAMVFNVGGYATERMRIDSSGNTTPGGDNTQDLGSPSKRWNDLYLGGGVYVGGTTSANLLDDYEEGTWTPVFGGSSTQGSYTYSTQSGVYIKIGDLVWVTCEIIIESVVSAGSGHSQVFNFPFTSYNGYNHGGAFLYHYGASLSKDMTSIGISNNSNSAIIVSIGVDGTQSLPQPTSWGAGDYVRFQLCYRI